MNYRTLRQGIDAIKQGYPDQGRRLIKLALKNEPLDGPIRATAFLWLAETTSDTQEKLDYYNNALEADPANGQARQRIAALMEADLPPITPPQGNPPYQNTPPQGMPPYQNTPPQGNPPYQNTPPQGTPPGTAQPFNYGNTSAQAAPDTNTQTVGIFDGPNGPGTGFFITQDGIVVTTRFVIAGVEAVTCEIGPGRTLRGQIVYAVPEYDIAFVYTGVSPVTPLTAAQTPNVPENTPLMALAYQQNTFQGIRRQTRSVIPAGWFPTTFDNPPDAGGNPILDRSGVVVGMLTRNTNRTSPYLFGVLMQTIYQYYERYRLSNTGGSTYCPGCGQLSRAAASGAYYCETCGMTLPQAANIRRQNAPQFGPLYGENAPRACPYCNSRAGFYDNRCIRCGR